MTQNRNYTEGVDRSGYDHMIDGVFVPAVKSWADEKWNLVPIRVRDEYCQCNAFPYGTPNLVGPSAILGKEFVDTIQQQTRDRYRDPKERGLRSIFNGAWCKDCLKPSKYTLQYVYRFCEGCGLSYVPRLVKESFPLRQLLCPKCDIPVPRRTTKRTGFRFS